MAEEVARFNSANGRRTVTVLRRSDGLYECRESILTDEGWQPSKVSGLYQTRGDAEAEAYAAARA